MNRLSASFGAIVVAIFCATTIAKAQDDPYAAIYDTILQPDADAAVARCGELRQAISEDASGSKRHDAFEKLAESWARIQASYILGGFDMDAMDYPLLIDYFHAGNEDLHASLQRIVEGDSPVETALYKNSYKTIGSLDDVMFSGPWSTRRAAMAKVIADNVCDNLKTVAEGYRAQRSDYLADKEKALSLLINAEIESVYKTRDWRIAQVAGLTKKTLGEYRPQDQQYPWSEVSWPVIGAIIDTHQKLLAKDAQPNLATIALQGDAGDGITAIQTALDKTAAAYAAVPPGTAFQTKEMIPIFSALQSLQKAFYDQLVQRLGVTVGLIDADGD